MIPNKDIEFQVLNDGRIWVITDKEFRCDDVHNDIVYVKIDGKTHVYRIDRTASVEELRRTYLASPLKKEKDTKDLEMTVYGDGEVISFSSLDPYNRYFGTCREVNGKIRFYLIEEMEYDTGFNKKIYYAREIRVRNRFSLIS